MRFISSKSILWILSTLTISCSFVKSGEAEVVVRVDPSTCKTEYTGYEIFELRCTRIEGEGVLRVRFAKSKDGGLEGPRHVEKGFHP